MAVDVELTLTPKKLIKQRESQFLEFKQSFNLGESLLDYAKTLVGMANNQGGMIVFGVKDKPHEPVGLKDERFETFDPKELNKALLNHFSCDLSVEIFTWEKLGMKLGVFAVAASTVKPVICIKKNDKKGLRESAIYYRYRAETTEIRYPELIALLDAERDKERSLWMKHIQSIATIGPHAVQMFNSDSGEMNFSGAKVLLDPRLVSKLKVIKEGSFSEKKGAPTLRLIGELEGLVSHDHVIYSDAAYPHLQSNLVEKLGLRSAYECQLLISYLKIKGADKYHALIKSGRKSHVNKYSEQAVQYIREEMRTRPTLVNEAKTEWSARQVNKVSRKLLMKK